MPAETLDEQAAAGAKDQTNGGEEDIALVEDNDNELATKPTEGNRFQQAITSWRSMALTYFMQQVADTNVCQISISHI